MPEIPYISSSYEYISIFYFIWKNTKKKKKSDYYNNIVLKIKKNILYLLNLLLINIYPILHVFI